MFFGKSKKRKSYIVGTPEYDQYEESDNTQDMLDLQERMKKHGFEGGPGINKDRWIYGDDIFDIDRPAGGVVQIWDMKEADYNKLKDLLDKLDANSEGSEELDYNDKDIKTPDDFDYDNVADDMLDKYIDEHESEDTNVSNIAKALTANDLGRSL